MNNLWQPWRRAASLPRHPSFIFTILFAIVALAPRSAQAQLRIVSYNTASDARTGLDDIFEAIGLQSVNGIARPIDVLALQEQDSSATTTQAVLAKLNAVYGAGVYARATIDGGTSGAGRPGLIYNTQTIQNIPTSDQVPLGTISLTSNARQTMRYKIRPVGYDGGAEFYMYVSHFKASDTGTDEARRLAEATTNRADADALGQGTHVIYSGDLNVYSSGDNSYEKLLSAGNGQAFDPIFTPGGWSEDSDFKAVHTQSPAASAQYPGQITGGMDDRFDFQLITDEFRDGEGLSYIGFLSAGVPIPNLHHTPSTHSYRAFGNDNTHTYNQSIRTGSGLTPALLDALENVTDHLPVVADYQLPARMTVSTATVAPRVMQSVAANASLTVTNSANVTVVAGADELNYTATPSGAVSGVITDVDNPLGTGKTHQFALNTSTTGPKSGNILVNTSSQGVPTADNNQNRAVNYTVVANRAVSPTSVDFGTVIVGGTVMANTSLTTSGDDNERTRVTVKGTAIAADANGVSVLAASDALFNTAGSTGSRTLSAMFNSAGLKNGNRPLIVQGEGLAGELVGAVSPTYSATALDHSQASFNGSVDQNALTVDFGTVARGIGTQNLGFSIFNLVGTPSFTAELDLDSITPSGDTAKLTTDLALFGNLAAGDSNVYSAFFNTNNSGTFEAIYNLAVSDQNLPGASAGTNLVLTVRGQVSTAPINLTWTGATNDQWDAGLTTNWVASGPAITYEEGDNVLLSDTGTGTVSLSGSLHPGSVIVNNTLVDYSIGGSGQIAGTTGLEKNGPGSLTVSMSNSYTGNTSLKAGTVLVNADNALGSGASVVQLGDTSGSNNASLLLSANVVLDRDIIVQDDGQVGTSRTLGGVAATGTAVLSGDLILNKSLSLTATTGGNLALTGTLTNSGGHTITKTNGGTVTLSGPGTHGPGSLVKVAAGTLSVDASLNNPLGGTPPIEIDTGATFNVAAGTLTLGSVRGDPGMLAISNGATGVLQSGFAQNRIVGAIDTHSSGTLDITDGAVIVDYSGASPYSSLTAQLKRGINLTGGGFWNGTGILSSTAGADAGPTAIGIIEASDLALLGRTSLVDPQSGNDPLDADAIVMKYTYWGDADMDGDNDIDDFIFWSSAFPSASGATWFTGDFDYDGDNDVDDFIFWSSTFPTLGPLLGNVATVPEPATLSLLAGGLALLVSCRYVRSQRFTTRRSIRISTASEQT